MKIKVLVFPKDSNPYQDLLYKHISNLVEITYLKGITSSQTINNLLFPFQLIFYRAKGYKIVHLHWMYKFTFPGITNISITCSTIYYYLILSFIKICGYKIVWTVHNVLPHNKIFIDDVNARRFLSRISSAKIIHSSATLEELRKYNIDTNNSHIIPIGNYIDIYPNIVTRKKARQKLRINNSEFVFLCLGKIEPYKGIEKLVSTFSKLNKAKTKLIIAGRWTDTKCIKRIQKYRKPLNVIIDNKFIPDDEIQTYFNAADITVYPFDKVTTSSSVMLALSYKKPVIFPRIGNLIDLPGDIGYSYNPGDTEGLRNCLEASINNKSNINKLSFNAYTYAKKLDWKNTARYTHNLYKSLVSHK